MTSIQEPDIDETALITSLQQYGYDDPTTEIAAPVRALFEIEVRKLLTAVAAHHEPYVYRAGDIDVYIAPNVFSPRYFTDSWWFAINLSAIVGNNRLLDIGTGTDIIAVVAALAGADVAASDINPDAVENARINFMRHGIQGNVFAGSLFEGIPSNETFDFIFWNHPFISGNSKETLLAMSGFDYQYEGIKGYINKARDHLSSNGRLLLGTGTFAELSRIDEIGCEAGYAVRVLKREVVPLQPRGRIKTEFRIVEFVEIYIQLL